MRSEEFSPTPETAEGNNKENSSSVSWCGQKVVGRYITIMKAAANERLLMTIVYNAIMGNKSIWN